MTLSLPVFAAFTVGWTEPEGKGLPGKNQKKLEAFAKVGQSYPMENIKTLSKVCGLLWLLGLTACGTQAGDEANVSSKSDEDRAKPQKTQEKTTTTEKTPPAAEPGDFPAPPDVAEPPADAEKTESGLASKVLKPGTGMTHPSEVDKVKVHYTGWTTDGKMFDSSKKRNRPAEFPLAQVIAGWTEGLQLMVEGEHRRLWIPQELAYQGRPGKPAGMLVFDVELLGITPGPKTPEDVAVPPPEAKKTKSGIAYRVLQAGTGKDHPKADDLVKVHYSGWTTDGKMFDSSVMRGRPASFNLDRVIPGWTEGVQLMVVGEKTRFWIPEDLAYKGKRGPQGTLVFDIELLNIGK